MEQGSDGDSGQGRGRGGGASPAGFWNPSQASSAPPKPRGATWGSREAVSSVGPHLPTGSAHGDRKGLFLEKGESSLKTDMVVF